MVPPVEVDIISEHPALELAGSGGAAADDEASSPATPPFDPEDLEPDLCQVPVPYRTWYYSSKAIKGS